jgi:Tfp pilus assembly protein PilV
LFSLFAGALEVLAGVELALSVDEVLVASLLLSAGVLALSLLAPPEDFDFSARVSVM